MPTAYAAALQYNRLCNRPIPSDDVFSSRFWYLKN